MIPMDFDWLANVLATDYQGDNRQVININTDTRTLCDGEVFLALKGPNFDGHKFIDQAKQNGAIGVIVDHAVNTDIAQFVVADTRIALGELGAAVMASVAPKTIAITGSVVLDLIVLLIIILVDLRIVVRRGVVVVFVAVVHR